MRVKTFPGSGTWQTSQGTLSLLQVSSSYAGSLTTGDLTSLELVLTGYWDPPSSLGRAR